MAVKRWDGADADWTSAADWTPPGEPGAHARAVVGSGDVFVTSDVREIKLLNVMGAVDVDPGGTLTTSGNVDVSSSGDLLNEDTLNVGGVIHDHGNLSNDGFLNASRTLVTGTAAASATFDYQGGVSSRVIIGNHGILTGYSQYNAFNEGTVGNVSVRSGGEVEVASLGAGEGVSLTVNNEKLASGSIFDLGPFFDTAVTTGENVNGKISLGGATLQASLIPNYSPAPGKTFDIVSSTKRIGGTFAGLPEGATLDLGGTAFTISYKHRNVTLTAQAPVCFVAGTSIHTAGGDVTIEALREGDTVVTAAGEYRQVKWLGHRSIDCARSHDPRAAWPVRVSEDAFGPGLPERDLHLSPGHSICVRVIDELLIPVGALINGSTITQVTVDEVTYWHIELECHDILLANGLPAESYLEMGNRGFFVEAPATSLGAMPDTVAVSHADFCRPYLAAGPVVDAVRARLAARAESLTSKIEWRTSHRAI